MRGARVDDVRDFRARTERLLLADELRHSVPLGVLGTIEDDPGRYRERHLWIAEDSGAAAACALMTPPFRLLVAGAADGFDSLVAAIRADGLDVPGVTGFVPEVEEFAACWSAATGDSTHTRMLMRMYSADAVTPVDVAAGAMRAARDDDRPLLREWARAFAAETGVPEGPEELATSIDARLGADPGLVLWEVEGVPVTLAGASVSSPGIARVGPVYTPPEHRRRGYATSLVAAWTSELLCRSMRRCALFTDLANPTSNSIYQAVGYRPYADAAVIDFV
ncbi:MAG TPA: GNAT family N-acetyltransferase [Gaiellales bacterium]|nr:GNAT family N-acetyltransferase [Gaiellales bacterium]